MGFSIWGISTIRRLHIVSLEEDNLSDSPLKTKSNEIACDLQHVIHYGVCTTHLVDALEPESERIVTVKADNVTFEAQKLSDTVLGGLQSVLTAPVVV